MLQKIIRMITGTEPITDYKAAVYRTFNTLDGKRIIEEFIAHDYSNPMKNLEGAALAYEEGRRSVVKEFLDICRFNEEKIQQLKEINNDKPDPYSANDPRNTAGFRT